MNKHGLLIKEMNCKKCKKPMKLVGKKHTDVLKWRCLTYSYNKRGKSIRKRSILYGARIILRKKLNILSELSQNSQIKRIKLESGCDYKSINASMASSNKNYPRKK